MQTKITGDGSSSWQLYLVIHLMVSAMIEEEFSDCSNCEAECVTLDICYDCKKEICDMCEDGGFCKECAELLDADEKCEKGS
jgi:hypothetical protein